MKKQKAQKIYKVPLFDSKGNKANTLELSKDVFTGEVNKSLLYQALVMYRANQRRGTASTKTRGEVRGAGKKPWRQKGTGRARVGSIRNPVWRGGGVAFGPRPRDFRYTLPKKLKKAAFISSLNAKLKAKTFLAIESISLEEPKTKKISKILGGLRIKAKERVLLLVETIDKNLFLASRNIKTLTVKKVKEATALDVLSSTHLVMTREALASLKKDKESK